MEGACEYPPEATAWISPVVPNPECLKRFLRSGQYSDLVIRCGDRTWNVHKVVVCSQCEFLQNACSKGFQEEQSGIIELNHDPADAVDAMLEWAYSGNYLLPKAENENRHRLLDLLLLNVRVHILAEKYFMEGLRSLAWINVIMWVDKYTVDSDDDAVKLTEIIAVTYDYTPDSGHLLRSFILNLAFKKIKTLLVCDQFQEYLKSGSAFSVEIIRRLTRDVEPPDSTADSDSDSDWSSDRDSDDTPSNTDS